MFEEQRTVQQNVGWANPSDGEALLGEFPALLKQIGSPEALSDLSLLQELWPVTDGPDAEKLHRFLDCYQTQILVRLEFPAIARASVLAMAGKSRELLALDQEIAREPLLAPFASASRCIGRLQLERLRPLRDERVIQRYLTAVTNGEAAGLHTIVYGVILAVYSLPLRQSLMIYGRQTLAALGHAVARSHSMSELACGDALQALFDRLPDAIEQVTVEFSGSAETFSSIRG